jgi:hypothetical protein
MKQYWSEGELVECWTLTGVERQLSDQRTQRGRLGLAVLLKFFRFEGRLSQRSAFTRRGLCGRTA